MQRNKLTDAKIRGSKPKGTPYKVSDGSGLFLLVQPGGARFWRWRFWLDGKEQVFAIGAYPDVSLADARNAADEARALVKRGISPVHARKDERQRNIAVADARERENEGAFAKVADAWLEAGKLEWAPVTYAAKKARVEKHLRPALGALPVRRITPAEIRPILAKCVGSGAWAAVYVKGDLSAIIEFAVVRGLCDSNPVPGLRGLVRIPKSEGKAVLSLAQIREFSSKITVYRGYPETAMCLRLISLTACRPGEAADAEWSEFDLDAKLWRRPAEKMKGRRDHLAPLSTQTVSLLEKLRVYTGKGRYLFPHRDTADTFATKARLSYIMKGFALGKGASPHCWRTTFSTWANERAFRPDAVELQLAHAERNRVRATYNRALLIDERRTMMQAWADYLGVAESENVIPFRSAAS